MTLTPTAFGITDQGKVRKTNEDQFLIAELMKSMRVWQTSLAEPRVQFGQEHAHLFLVADGMGGQSAGERASALAVVAIEHFALNTFKWFLGSEENGAETALAQFQAALEQADAQLRQASAKSPELSGMGTTLTLAFHLGAQMCVVHAGDSRAYLHRKGRLTQVTHDHTVTADLVRKGLLNPAQAGGHRFRHLMTNVIGGHQNGVKVEAHAFELQAGDRLLLCSDGLTETVKNEAIAATLEAESSPEVGTRKLLSLALEAGAPDNLTILIARFDGPAAVAA